MKGFLLPGVLAGGVVSGGVQQKVSTNSEVMKTNTSTIRLIYPQWQGGNVAAMVPEAIAKSGTLRNGAAANYEQAITFDPIAAAMQGIQGAQGLHTACGIHARDGDLRPHTCHRAWQSIVLIAPLAELEHRAVLHQGCQRPRGRGLADL